MGPRTQTGTQSRFNPLPPPKRGETWDQCGLIGCIDGFQSTPPAEARGDLRLGLARRGVAGVSIHSPRRSEGRLGGDAPTFESQAMGFNPLPPPKRGETAYSQLPGSAQSCFNPLPPPKRGETLGLGCESHVPLEFQSTPPAEARGDFAGLWEWDVDGVSIHSPRRSEGRLALTAVSFGRSRVSIHSPRRSEGRRVEKSRQDEARYTFQSTPPAEARGDGSPACRSASGEGVSIHSPRRSEGRRSICAASSCAVSGFNPLPPPKRGETGHLFRRLVAEAEFQSTPPAEARGDVRPAPRARPSALSVSIHSPRRSEGRRPTCAKSASFCSLSFNPLPPPKRGETSDLRQERVLLLSQFQSTPPAEARGDPALLAESLQHPQSFNPLPPPKRGETADPGRPDSTVVYGSLSAILARQLAPIDRRRAKIYC